MSVIRVAATSPPKPLGVSTATPDRGARIRQLQKALARAECYNGPISGVWSEASKDAMHGFVHAVNAELPIDVPDEALVALVESNETAKCARGRAIETGTLGSSLPAAAARVNSGFQASKSVAPPSSSGADRTIDAPTLLGHPWAPAAMLITGKDTTSVNPTTIQGTLRSGAAEVTASNDVSSSEGESAPQSSAKIQFEGGGPLPAVQPVDPPLSGPSSDPRTAAPAKQKKSKTARRRPAKTDDVETTISKGFDSLQRSISSMF